MSRALFADRGLRIGLGLTGITVLMAAAGPWLAPHGFDQLLGTPFGAPQLSAPLGYDYMGRDVWSRLLAGGWSILWMSLAASALALIAGTALGLLAGEARGRVDKAVVWGTDVLLAFPELMLVLLVVSMLGRDPWLIVLTVSLAFLPGVIRLARGLALGIAGQEFVEAARLIGYPRLRILAVEMLPNMAAPLLVQFGVMLTWAVSILAGLSFLGYGVAPPAADWGLMINENRSGIVLQPWSVAAPIAAIAVFTLGVNLLAEAFSRHVAQSGVKP
ncbi:MAG: ABC transporter permease [Novosphingobium sp.]